MYARDIQEHGSVRIVNPDHLLFTLQDDRDISGELYVNKGRGYVEAELHPADRSLPVDLVRIDAIYNPVRRANFTVAETRVGQRTDYDRLTVTLETNGTISPEDAIAYAAALAQVPIMASAVFLLHGPQGFFVRGMTIDTPQGQQVIAAGYEFALLVLVATIALILLGPGAMAVDGVRRRGRRA